MLTEVLLNSLRITNCFFREFNSSSCPAVGYQKVILSGLIGQFNSITYYQ
jgi:hypothetical protein